MDIQDNHWLSHPIDIEIGALGFLLDVRFNRLDAPPDGTLCSIGPAMPRDATVWNELRRPQVEIFHLAGPGGGILLLSPRLLILLPACVLLLSRAPPCMPRSFGLDDVHLRSHG